MCRKGYLVAVAEVEGAVIADIRIDYVSPRPLALPLPVAVLLQQRVSSVIVMKGRVNWLDDLLGVFPVELRLGRRTASTLVNAWFQDVTVTYRNSGKILEI